MAGGTSAADIRRKLATGKARGNAERVVSVKSKRMVGVAKARFNAAFSVRVELTLCEAAGMVSSRLLR